MERREDNRKNETKENNEPPSLNTGYGLVFAFPSTVVECFNIFSLSFVISSISFSACFTSVRMAFTCIPVKPVVEQLNVMGCVQMPHYQMQLPRAILD